MAVTIEIRDCDTRNVSRKRCLQYRAFQKGIKKSKSYLTEIVQETLNL